jgi:hypothetical protein
MTSSNPSNGTWNKLKHQHSYSLPLRQDEPLMTPPMQQFYQAPNSTSCTAYHRPTNG